MIGSLIVKATVETGYMVGVALVLSALLGIPLGILLVITAPRHIKPLPLLHRAFSMVVNVGRSLPFIILLVAIIPFTRWLVGTSIGTAGAIVPLTISAIPFMARVVESALLRVIGVSLRRRKLMGASTRQIIAKVLLPEAVPGLVLGVTMVAVSLISYSAMAGAVGGGGLGDLAIRFGYQRFRGDIMFWTVLVLVAIVQGLQSFGGWLAAKLNHR